VVIVEGRPGSLEAGLAEAHAGLEAVVAVSEMELLMGLFQQLRQGLVVAKCVEKEMATYQELREWHSGLEVELP
jgi:hypothetical protein